MATRSTNTMQEVLQRFLTDLAQAKTLPDADLPFILSLETQIVDYIRKPIKDLQAQQQLPPGGPDAGQGAPPDFAQFMGGQQAPQATPPSAGGSGGVMPSAPAPNPDELRRLLGAGVSN